MSYDQPEGVTTPKAFETCMSRLVLAPNVNRCLIETHWKLGITAARTSIDPQKRKPCVNLCLIPGAARFASRRLPSLIAHIGVDGLELLVLSENHWVQQAFYAGSHKDTLGV